MFLESMDRKSSQDRNTLIEQSVEAQNTLIEHSNPHLATPFENFWIHPRLRVFLLHIFGLIIFIYYLFVISRTLQGHSTGVRYNNH